MKTLSLATLCACVLAAFAHAQGPPPPPNGDQIKPGGMDLIKASVYADNWFMMYINGKLAAVDPIDFLPHNEVTVDVLPEYPMTIAIMAKDNADPQTGLEYGNHIGDGGFILKFTDGTISNAAWKAKSFFRGPLNGDINHPTVQYETIPDNWYAADFDDSAWDSATEFETDRVKPDGNYAAADFTGAKFIWTSDLDLDNTIILRYRVEKPGWVKRWNTTPDLDVVCVFYPLPSVCLRPDLQQDAGKPPVLSPR
jgi:hypothetical protein